MVIAPHYIEMHMLCFFPLIDEDVKITRHNTQRRTLFMVDSYLSCQASFGRTIVMSVPEEGIAVNVTAVNENLVGPTYLPSIRSGRNG